MRTTLAFLTVLLVALVVPLAAQETVPQPEDPPAVDELAPAEQAPSDATPTEPTPAWEFSLNASARAPGASGVVQITEGETENRFVVPVSGLPPHDSLDVEDFDAEAY